MVSSTAFFQVLAAALSVSAKPVVQEDVSILKSRQFADGFDVRRNCNDYAPPEGRCGVISDAADSIVPNTQTFVTATLVDGGCNTIDSDDLSSMDQGFDAELTLPSGRSVTVEFSVFGLDSMAEPTIRIDGDDVSGLDCEGRRTRNDGGTARAWKMCHFEC